MMILDGSGSMVSPWSGINGRYDSSAPMKLDVEIKYAVKFIESRKNDSIGTMIYSDNPYLVSSFNWEDHEALISIVRLLTVHRHASSAIAGEGGTGTGEALIFANNHILRYGKAKEKTIILFTDGECNMGRSLEAAFAEIVNSKSQVKIFVLGIDYYNNTSAQELASFAKASGGEYFPIDTEEDLKQAVYALDRRVGENRFTVDEYIVDKDQYYYFTFISLVLLFFVILLKPLHYFRDLL